MTLRPDRCDECGDCVADCPKDAIRVGSSYILVDWKVCDQCCVCVEACDRAAIVREIVPARESVAMPAVAPGDVSKVVVGSRAEAKAVRKAAEKAAKQTARGARSPSTMSAPVVMRAATVDAGGVAAVGTVTRTVALRTAKTATAEQEAPKFGSVQWTMVDVAALLAVLLIALIGKNAVRDLPAVGLMPATGRMFVRAALLVVYYGVQFGTLVLLAGRHGARFVDAFGLGRRAANDVDPTPAGGSAGLILGLFLATEFISLAYGYAVQSVGWRQPLTLSTDVAAVFGRGGIGVALAVVLVAVAAPLAEELAYRGVLLPAFGARWGMRPAIVVSSVLFAASHFNLWMFFPTLVLGLASGWLAWTRRSLWPSIAVHVLYNGVAVAAAFLIAR